MCWLKESRGKSSNRPQSGYKVYLSPHHKLIQLKHNSADGPKISRDFNLVEMPSTKGAVKGGDSSYIRYPSLLIALVLT